MISTGPNIAETLKKWSGQFDQKLPFYLQPDGETAPDILLQAMRHSMLAPGKRLRPFLVDRSFRLAGGAGDSIEWLCASVECLHVFTLIHDDLPCMDNADLRRGLPSNHKVYGEAIAVLAGDALLTLGFELACRYPTDPKAIVQFVQELSRAIGWKGVIGGQVADIAGQNQPPNLEQAEFIHHHKTAHLFQCCCRLGALAAGASIEIFKKLSDFGLHLGLAFQIADDILDLTGDSAQLGKMTGSDPQMRKQTYPAVVGISESRRLGKEAVQRALNALESFDQKADELRQLVWLVMNRTR